MLKGLLARSKRLALGAILSAAVAIPLLAPRPAQAWWGPGWGWHAGWGWRPGVVVGLPPVVVGAPVYAPYPAVPPYPAAAYVPPEAYAPPYWHWVPTYRANDGTIVAGHWEHR